MDTPAPATQDGARLSREPLQWHSFCRHANGAWRRSQRSVTPAKGHATRPQGPRAAPPQLASQRRGRPQRVRMSFCPGVLKNSNERWPPAPHAAVLAGGGEAPAGAFSRGAPVRGGARAGASRSGAGCHICPPRRCGRLRAARGECGQLGPLAPVGHPAIWRGVGPPAARGRLRDKLQHL